MKHLKRFAACCAAAVCCAAMLLLATGCQQQQESYTPPEATPSVSKPVIAQEGVLRVGVNANTAYPGCLLECARSGPDLCPDA